MINHLKTIQMNNDIQIKKMINDITYEKSLVIWETLFHDAYKILMTLKTYLSTTVYWTLQLNMHIGYRKQR